MRIRILAIGTRIPRWAQEACTDYLNRLNPSQGTTLIEIAAGKRSAGSATARAIAEESAQLAQRLDARHYVVALDERGRELSTRALSQWLEARRHDGRDVTFIIGGPDGLAPDIRAQCQETIGLSKLTLPHALARVLLIEQLYRAQSILAGHPYHRD